MWKIGLDSGNVLWSNLANREARDRSTLRFVWLGNPHRVSEQLRQSRKRRVSLDPTLPAEPKPRRVDRTMDPILRPVVHLVVLISALTSVRLFLVSLLLPLYFVFRLKRSLGTVILNLRKWLSQHGRKELVEGAQMVQQSQNHLAQAELLDNLVIPRDMLSACSPLGPKQRPDWPFQTDYIKVCGAQVAYHHTGTNSTKSKIPIVVLLHGSPAWSYSYRRLIPILEAHQYHPIALDFIGHGLSDRLLERSFLNVELHMATIKVFFDQVLSKLSGPIIVVAHDWGG